MQMLLRLRSKPGYSSGIPTLGDSKFVSKISFRTRQNISASVNSGQTIGRGLPPLGRPEARGLHPQRLALLG
ncbi:hypothetical protein P8C59_002868 [Phyllachora maydis]|uniref:Uncharacterized protein n=1 Tax=Phyllachora maydis TaxID=1825666 RepID=A0AAD9HZ34_9PEZI|nr:hypothetical protein P8C59_002868 [Phyllachora maydis]